MYYFYIFKGGSNNTFYKFYVQKDSIMHSIMPFLIMHLLVYEKINSSKKTFFIFLGTTFLYFVISWCLQLFIKYLYETMYVLLLYIVNSFNAHSLGCPPDCDELTTELSMSCDVENIRCDNIDIIYNGTI